MSDEGRPKHYEADDPAVEPIRVIESWAKWWPRNVAFHLGNALKYLARAGRKGGESMCADLRKARWYIDRAIEVLEAHDA